MTFCCAVSPTIQGRLATAETRSPSKPANRNAEPFEVARASVESLAGALREVAEAFEKAERQVRNARMTDAVELGPVGLSELYPEAVGPDGLMSNDAEARFIDPSEEPYEFWTLTKDAAITTRLGGAIETSVNLADQLLKLQPKVV